MKINVIKIFLISGILVFLSNLSAYENPLFPDIKQRDQFNSPFNLYELSANPAFHKIIYLENRVYYQAQAGDKLNLFRRTFDPKREQNYQFYFYANKVLDENTSIAAAAKYSRTDQFQVYRSLEKNFYDHYFSYVDTTTGNVTYDGPQVWFLYNRSISKILLLGLRIDYGVENGLKDVYTKCETILRNIDVNLGLGYQSSDHSTIMGIYGRYFNRQGKYTAVKELQDAFVRTYFGYHIFKDENSRSANRKSDNRQGYEFSAQFEKKNLLMRGLGIQFAGSYGITETKVEAGSERLPMPRGYWVREGTRFIANLYYYPEKEKMGFQVFYEYKCFGDWAKSGFYDVTIIVNDEIMYRFGSVLYLPLMNKVGISTGFEMENIRSDYHEYIVKFDYNREHHNWNAFTDFKLAINQITNAHIKGTIGTVEPWFYWNTDKFDIAALQFGFDRLFVFGTLGLDFNYEVWKPDGADKNIETFGLSVSYWK